MGTRNTLLKCGRGSIIKILVLFGHTTGYDKNNMLLYFVFISRYILFQKFIHREYSKFRKCLTQHRVSTNHGDKYLHDDFAFIDLISNIKYYIVSLFDSLWDSLWTKIFVRSRILIFSSILAFKVWCRAK